MTPCSGSVITPRMIRRGQVQIGDKIELEDMRVSVSEENTKEAVSVSAEAAVSQRGTSEEKTADVSSAVSANAAPVNAASADTAPETAVPVSAPVPPQQIAAEAMQADAVPAAAMPQTQNSSVNENGVCLRPQANAGMQGNAGMQSHMNMQGSTAPTYSDWNTTFQSSTASIPLIFQHMTDYVNPLAHTGQQSPRFGVPSNPLVPPEYEQSIDYDSAQYMNGFLRTQIGRAMRVEQLIGSNGIQDRYGFLVGVGNNYLLLQDISNGNIAIVDLYSVKYVYVYFNDPVFPGTPFTNGGR